MKKLFIAALLTIAIAATASAGSFVENARLEALFKAAYPGATHVHYKTVGELVSVTFIWNNYNMQAFYNSDAEKVAVSRVIKFSNLPMRGQEAVNQRYEGFNVLEVIEMDSLEEGTCYYVSLNRDSKKLIVRVSVLGDVSVFKRIK